MATYLFGFLAGSLSILSPCVLPLLPIVLGAAAGRHRWGPLALALGLTLSFVGIGLFLALAGYALGVSGAWIRNASGLILTVAGLILLVPGVGAVLTRWLTPLSQRLDARLGGVGERGSLLAQFAMGLVLGGLWTPCVGPTLGAAILLASQGEQLGQVALTMTAFGLGAGLPLALLGTLSRQAILRWRSRLLASGRYGRRVLGLLLVVIGVMTLSGVDKIVEAWLVQVSPAWLTWLTTRF